MDFITKLQKDYKYFENMLKRLEKQKKTPGNGCLLYTSPSPRDRG